ncbi:MAG: hypothetical protein HRU19_21115 [Pseudobacteriovorax sp.]|nr:hypothetical protein [Pseudobacteriovorax sp.]
MFKFSSTLFAISLLMVSISCRTSSSDKSKSTDPQDEVSQTDPKDKTTEQKIDDSSNSEKSWSPWVSEGYDTNGEESFTRTCGGEDSKCEGNAKKVETCVYFQGFSSFRNMVADLVGPTLYTLPKLQGSAWQPIKNISGIISAKVLNPDSLKFTENTAGGFPIDYGEQKSLQQGDEIELHSPRELSVVNTLLWIKFTGDGLSKTQDKSITLTTEVFGPTGRITENRETGSCGIENESNVCVFVLSPKFSLNDSTKTSMNIKIEAGGSQLSVVEDLSLDTFFVFP